MSAEYRPIPALQFDAIDKRLKKYGIKVDCVVQSPLSSGHTVLSSPLRRETAPVFPIMTASGFFTRTGQRYQMTIPQGVNIGAIRDALLELAEREGEHSFLHPESLLITMTRMEAETWKRRLEGINWQQCLADRELLLDS